MGHSNGVVCHIGGNFQPQDLACTDVTLCTHDSMLWIAEPVTCSAETSVNKCVLPQPTYHVKAKAVPRQDRVYNWVNRPASDPIIWSRPLLSRVCPNGYQNRCMDSSQGVVTAAQVRCRCGCETVIIPNPRLLSFRRRFQWTYIYSP